MLPRDARKATGLILVPVLMVLADVAASRTALKFLLLPPFAALTYVVFVNPGGVPMNIRRVIVCPACTALLAWGSAGTLGYNALSVGVVVVGTMLLMWVLDSRMVVPPLALALLTVLLYKQVRGRIDYPISVLAYTIVLYGIFRLWSWLPLERFTFGEPGSDVSGTGPE